MYADSSDNKTHIRNLSNLSDSEEDKKKVEEAINSNKEIDAIVEYVFNCAIVSVYIPQWSCFAKVNLRFVSIPSNVKEQELFKKGKAYCERMCLSKDIKMKKEIKMKKKIKKKLRKQIKKYKIIKKKKRLMKIKKIII